MNQQRIYSEVSEDLTKAIITNNAALLPDLAAEMNTLGTHEAEVDATYAMAMYHRLKNDTTAAIDGFNRSIEGYTILGKTSGVANAHSSLGLTLLNWSEHRKALDHFLTALELHVSVGDRNGEARVTCNVGLAYDRLDDVQQAFDYYNRSMEIAKEVGDFNCVAVNLSNIGGIYQRWGNQTKALECYHESIEVDKSNNHKRLDASNLSSIGTVYWDVGNYPSALEYFQKALEIHTSIGNNWGCAIDTGNIGNVHAAIAEHDKALHYFTEALAMLEVLGDPHAIAHTHCQLAAVANATGQYETAIEHLTAASQIFDKHEMTAQQVSMISFWIKALLALDRFEDAVAKVAAIDPKTLNDRRMEGVYHSARADVAMKMEEYDTASEEWQLSLQCARDVNMPLAQVNIHKSLRDLALNRNDLAGYVEHNNEVQRLDAELSGKETTQRMAMMEAEQRIATERQERQREQQERQREQAILYSTLPKHVADRMARGEAVNDHYDNASVMFLDIVGFTTLAGTLTSQQVTTLLDVVFGICDEACSKNNVTRIKTIGDSYLAFCE